QGADDLRAARSGDRLVETLSGVLEHRVLGVVDQEDLRLVVRLGDDVVRLVGTVRTGEVTQVRAGTVGVVRARREERAAGLGTANGVVAVERVDRNGQNVLGLGLRERALDGRAV